MLSELAFPHIRCCLSAIPSDLMKSTAVDESLSTINQQFCSREKQLLQLFIQGMAWCTGFRMPYYNILSISCLNGSLRHTGTGSQGIMLGSTYVWYGGPEKHPVPSKTSGYACRICSLLVISLGTVLGQLDTV